MAERLVAESVRLVEPAYAGREFVRGLPHVVGGREVVRDGIREDFHCKPPGRLAPDAEAAFAGRTVDNGSEVSADRDAVLAQAVRGLLFRGPLSRACLFGYPESLSYV